MAEVFQIVDAYQREFGRPPTQAELNAARDLSIGQLNDLRGNIDRGLGINSYQDPVEAALNAAKNSAQQIIDQYNAAANKSKEFDQQNPFTFDEALARASANERFDPYYDAELNDYVTGANNARQRSTEDATRLQKELTADTSTYVGQVRRNVQDAIDTAKEGFAGSGLYASGQRIRREGKISNEGNQQIDVANENYRRGLASSQRELGRNLQDINLGQNTFERRLGSEKETNILTDIEKQRQDKLRQREYERQQYVGYPLGGGSSSLSSIYGV